MTTKDPSAGKIIEQSMTKSGASAENIMSASAAIVEAHTAVADAIKPNTPVETMGQPSITHTAKTERQIQNFDALPIVKTSIAFWTENIDATVGYLMQLPKAKNFEEACIIQSDFMMKNTHRAWHFVSDCLMLATLGAHQTSTP